MSKSIQLCMLILAVMLVRPAATQGEDAKDKAEPITPTEAIDLLNGKDMEGWIFNLKEDAQGSYEIKDGVLTLSGQPVGELRTEKSYTNYKLTLTWRWPDKAGNSGLLLHCGELNDPGKWPRCLESQLRAGDAGDLVGIGGYAYRVEGEDKASGGYKKNNSDDAEKPVGEWNNMTVICDGNRVVIYVNGEKVHECWDCETDAGPIGLQSEGTAIEFKTLRLEPLE